MAVSLSELRHKRGVTQVEVAERMGVSQVTVSKLERADNPTFASVRRYVEALGGEAQVVAVFSPAERITVVPGPGD